MTATYKARQLDWSVMDDHPERRVLQVGRSRRCVSMEARPSLRHTTRGRLLRRGAPRNDDCLQ